LLPPVLKVLLSNHRGFVKFYGPDFVVFPPVSSAPPEAHIKPDQAWAASSFSYLLFTLRYGANALGKIVPQYDSMDKIVFKRMNSFIKDCKEKTERSRLKQQEDCIIGIF
jgi:hypothetical protein